MNAVGHLEGVRKTLLQNGPENTVFGAVSVRLRIVRKIVVAITQLSQGPRVWPLAPKLDLQTSGKAAFAGLRTSCDRLSNKR